LLGRRVGRAEAVVGSRRHCVMHTTRVQIDRKNLRPGHSQEPARDLTDQSAADHRHAIANGDARESQAVKGDCGNRRKRCALERHRGRYPRAQVRLDGNDLGMVGESAPAQATAAPGMRPRTAEPTRTT
jgi:hypothetical protein